MIACPRRTRLALLLASLLPVREISKVGFHFADRIFDDRAAVDHGHRRKRLTEVPLWQGVGVLFGSYRLPLSPVHQFIGTDSPFPLLLMLLREIGNSFGELVTVGQKERHIEGAGSVENGCGCLQVGPLDSVGSALRTGSQVKREFGGTYCLPHLVHTP